MTLNDPCQGCYADSKYSCEHKTWNSNCPCANCIVKVICIETCDDFTIFSNECIDTKDKYIGRTPL